MAKNNYTELKERKIYIIIHPLTKQFFIHFTSAKSFRDTFHHHYSLHNSLTKKLFEEHRETLYPPEFYLLEDSECTISEAYQKQTAWIKYFIEQGFSCINSPDDIDCAKDLFEDTEIYYNSICSFSFDDVIANGNRILGNYGRHRSDVNKSKYAEGKKQLKAFCTDEEYDLIKEIAKSKGLTMSAYLREVALFGRSLEINYDAITEHTKEISRSKTQMNYIIQYLVEHHEVLPDDIIYMIDLLKELVSTEKELLRKNVNEQFHLRKKYKKIVADELKKASEKPKKVS